MHCALQSLQDAAKALSSSGFDTGPKKIFEQLFNCGVLMYSDSMNAVPYQGFIKREWFKVMRSHWKHPHTHERIPYCRTLLTEKGFESISKMIPKMQPKVKVSSWTPNVDISLGVPEVCVLGY